MVCVLLVSVNSSVNVKNKPFGAYFVLASTGVSSQKKKQDFFFCLASYRGRFAAQVF